MTKTVSTAVTSLHKVSEMAHQHPSPITVAPNPSQPQSLQLKMRASETYYGLLFVFVFLFFKIAVDINVKAPFGRFIKIFLCHFFFFFSSSSFFFALWSVKTPFWCKFWIFVIQSGKSLKEKISFCFLAFSPFYFLSWNCRTCKTLFLCTIKVIVCPQKVWRL